MRRERWQATCWSSMVSMLFLAALGATGVGAQQDNLPSPWQWHKVEAAQGNYLPTYMSLVEHDKAYRASDRAGYYVQVRGIIASYLGDQQEADQLFDGPGSNQAPAPLEPSSFVGYQPTDAETFLLKAADTNQVLMLNEQHYKPQTRVLTTRLLRGLYKKGFRYLALETLAVPGGSAETARRKYPTTDSGTFTNEPVFGDMMRQALEIGYTLVPYEYEGDAKPGATMIERLNTREMEEARNLKTRIFDKDPQAKVLVHAGVSHISEKPQPIPEENAPWVFMAMRLKQLTGIDPFTVDQQTMMPRSRVGAESPFYQDAVRRGLVTDHAVIFADTSGKPWSRPTEGLAVDAQVFLPPVRWADQRPDWMSRDLKRVAYPIPVLLQQGSGLRLVQAFFVREPGNAVPVDQVLLRPGAQPPALMLPRRNGGRFLLRTWDETGKIVATTTVKI